MADHHGLFGSHYDEGRITRSLDPGPFWSRVSRASIAHYSEIEAQGGIAFYTERSVVMADPEGSVAVECIGAVAAGCGAKCSDERGRLGAEVVIGQILPGGPAAD